VARNWKTRRAPLDPAGIPQDKAAGEGDNSATAGVQLPDVEDDAEDCVVVAIDDRLLDRLLEATVDWILDVGLLDRLLEETVDWILDVGLLDRLLEETVD
jgi:hypothetical protein